MSSTPDIKASMKNKLLALLRIYLWSVSGTILGGIGGFIYYNTVGCSTGTCPITSNPWLTILWGAMIGYLIGSTLKKDKKTKQNEKEHGSD